MNRYLTPARWIGLLLLLQMGIGPLVNFGLLGPALSAPPGFLQNAASHARDVHVATLLALVGSACFVTMALLFLSIAPATARAFAWAFVVIAVLGFATAVLEGTSIRAMLALSQAFHEAGATDARAFEPLRVTVRALRNAAHYTQIMLGGAGYLALFLGLLRARLVPRLLAGAGAVAAALVIAAALGPLLGGRIVMCLLTPIGLCLVALAGWLLARGASNPGVESRESREVHG
jgi:hypothetical protein